ncbi:MAG: UDP-N-acetylglucosamine 2-epimerase (hydrolyzing) [Lachnospiraceae bacterium]|nr:UDP-N-acetylglucosamine 2-epimerase (hydrolyzing) [Lachnospiraceae bacterium]
MIKMDVLTTTRAEYGLMRPLIRRLMNDADIRMRLLVTGTHLDQRFGLTYREIEDDNIPIYKKIEILSHSEGALFVSETMANALRLFTSYFISEQPDFLLVDGDRYETMAICLAAFNANVPIIHLSGGATTEGAADEFYRHAITKMALLHFPTTSLYRKRVIQLGESPDRVFTVGSLGIENILSTNLLSKEDLEKSINFKLDQPYCLITFHPVTLEKMTHLDQLNELLSACDSIPDLKFIFTMANADSGGNEINAVLLEYAMRRKDKVLCVKSLGSLRYLSAMKYCEFVMGNSSSGLIETPSFKIPTINIGDRQKGRIKAESVIDCYPSKDCILEAVTRARSQEFRDFCKHVVNPNGDGDTSRKIVEQIKKYCKFNTINLKKKFYDISF